MDYLARNATLLHEISGLELALGRCIGSSRKLTFHSAGSYHSTLLGSELFVGIKQYTRDHTHLQQHFRDALTLINAIQHETPDLVGELPAFYGRALVGDKECLVTEDCSQSGALNVIAYPSEELPNFPVPQSFKWLFGKDAHYWDLRNHLFSTFVWERKILDLDAHRLRQDLRERYAVDDIDRYTIRLALHASP